MVLRKRRAARDDEPELRNIRPRFNARGYAVLEALDPGGMAGDSDWGGPFALPDGMVLALRSHTGQIVGRFTKWTEAQGFRLFMRNLGVGTQPHLSVLRGFVVVTSLAGNGHNRTLYIRGDAEPGSTGYHNAIMAAVHSVAGSQGTAYAASSEGEPGQNVGLSLGTVVPWGTGVVIGPSLYAHMQHRTGKVTAAPGGLDEDVALVGATNDSSGLLLPANSTIRSVAVSAPAGVEYAVGDASNPERFLAFGTGSRVGLDHHAAGLAAQKAGAKVRITTRGTLPAAAVATVTVFFERYVFHAAAAMRRMLKGEEAALHDFAAERSRLQSARPALTASGADARPRRQKAAPSSARRTSRASSARAGRRRTS